MRTLPGRVQKAIFIAVRTQVPSDGAEYNKHPWLGVYCSMMYVSERLYISHCTIKQGAQNKFIAGGPHLRGRRSLLWPRCSRPSENGKRRNTSCLIYPAGDPNQLTLPAEIPMQCQHILLFFFVFSSTFMLQATNVKEFFWQRL